MINSLNSSLYEQIYPRVGHLVHQPARLVTKADLKTPLPDAVKTWHSKWNEAATALLQLKCFDEDQQRDLQQVVAKKCGRRNSDALCDPPATASSEEDAFSSTSSSSESDNEFDCT